MRVQDFRAIERNANHPVPNHCSFWMDNRFIVRSDKLIPSAVWRLRILTN